jgi:hypothetical protein
LETSNSVQPGEGIKLHHVICNSELVLKEVIGSGAEGKVGCRNDAQDCRMSLQDFICLTRADGQESGCKQR